MFIFVFNLLFINEILFAPLFFVEFDLSLNNTDPISIFVFFICVNSFLCFFLFYIIVIDLLNFSVSIIILILNVAILILNLILLILFNIPILNLIGPLEPLKSMTVAFRFEIILIFYILAIVDPLTLFIVDQARVERILTTQANEVLIVVCGVRPTNFVVIV